ncbi:rubrerythrin [Clostridium paraputrificum]|uniref:rubrerythrin n=1 Tax=Clostridium TaxID=1485 RepID=UPI003D335873
MELKDSRTKENLLRAFAGESQARNRYDFAAEVAKKEGLFIIQDLFKYTANQEKAHGEVYYGALKQFNGENINITAAYPIGDYPDTLGLLKSAQHNEREEWNQVYSEFAEIARNEGFVPIGTIFDNVASIEKLHDDRFTKYIEEMENGTLFKKGTSVQWMCTNCGYVYEGQEAPQLCPVCSYPQGYYMLFEDTQFETRKE